MVLSLVNPQRMREYERMKAEAEASGGTTSSAVLSNKQEDAGPSASDVTSNSSAQDMGSESSFSDLPVGGFLLEQAIS